MVVDSSGYTRPKLNVRSTNFDSGISKHILELSHRALIVGVFTNVDGEPKAVHFSCALHQAITDVFGYDKVVLPEMLDYNVDLSSFIVEPGTYKFDVVTAPAHTELVFYLVYQDVQS